MQEVQAYGNEKDTNQPIKQTQLQHWYKTASSKQNFKSWSRSPLKSIRVSRNCRKLQTNAIDVTRFAIANIQKSRNYGRDCGGGKTFKTMQLQTNTIDMTTITIADIQRPRHQGRN